MENVSEIDNISDRRLVENEMLFRSTNREVQRRVKDDRTKRDGPDSTKLHFYCECSRFYCRDRIKLTVDDYESATHNEKQFIVLPGHENETIEKVIRRTKNFLVVQKNIDPIKATAHERSDRV